MSAESGRVGVIRAADGLLFGQKLVENRGEAGGVFFMGECAAVVHNRHFD